MRTGKFAAALFGVAWPGCCPTKPATNSSPSASVCNVACTVSGQPPSRTGNCKLSNRQWRAPAGADSGWSCQPEHCALPRPAWLRRCTSHSLALCCNSLTQGGAKLATCTVSVPRTWPSHAAPTCLGRSSHSWDPAHVRDIRMRSPSRGLTRPGGTTVKDKKHGG